VFDHLDDPVPYEPSEALHAAVVRRGRSRRRRHRLAVGGASTVAALAVGAVGGAALIDRRLDDLQHVDVAALGDDAGSPRTEPTTLLLVGVDSDAGLAAPDPARPPSGRTDAVVVVRVDPGRHVVSVLPLPRDLWVELPGLGRDRLANARERGGPDLLIATLQADLGIEVDRYAETDFAGAVAIGDALGGARLAFDHPVRDAPTGLSLDAGCQTVAGGDLLALGRARHLAEEVDGTWRNDPTSDLGRIERQQAVLGSVLAELLDLSARDPLELARVVDEVIEHLTVDSSTTPGDLLDLARATQGAPVVSRRLGVVDAVRDGKAVLELVSPDDPALEALRNGSRPAPGEAPAGSAGPAPVVPTAC